MKALVIGSGEFYFPYEIKEWFVIACDGGLDHCRAHNISPDRILGDFDSVSADTFEFYKNSEKTVYPAKKDMTDLELGIRLAIELGAEEIIVTGALSSTRFDHSLCNISLLLICLEKGIKAK
ncbi:MAG: thiamine diphosphokinase, partial [Firmicutes bacterium]|nr:thiamine diphosphokinase [Bacillota bacterium]